MKKIFLFILLDFSLLFYAQRKWTLREAVEYSATHNFQIIQSGYAIQLQSKNLEIAKREKLPYISGSFSNSTSFGQGQDIFGNIRRNDNFNNSANIGGNIQVFNNGRLQKMVIKTEYDVEASRYDSETIQRNTTLQILQAYLAVLISKEILKISQSTCENAQRMYERAKITTEIGATPQTILAEADAALARERQNIKNAEVNIERNLFQLAQLLQLPDYHNFDVEDISTESIIPYNGFQTSILDNAYKNQPQIRGAETRVKAAEARFKVAKTSFWPTITASAGFGSFYFNSLVTNTVGFNSMGTPIRELSFLKQYRNNFGQQLGLNANIPIFNKGITKIQVEQAKINVEATKNLLEQAKQEIKQNMQRAQFDAEANYQFFIAAEQAEKSGKLALEFAQKSFDAGRITVYDLSIARNNYANAQGSLVQAKYNYIFSLKLLDFYSGLPLSL